MVVLLATTPFIIFSEDFNGPFPPFNWRIYNGGDTTTWKGVDKGFKPFENSNFSGKYAICDSDIGYDAIFNDSLTSPPIFIGYAYDSLKLYLDAVFKKFPGDPDTGKVLVSVFNGSWSPWMEVLTLSSDSVYSGFIDITSLTTGADSLRVSFWYGTRFWDYYFGVDNFKVVYYKDFNYDFSADSIISPDYALRDSSYTLRFHLSNLGINGDTVKVYYGVSPSLDSTKIFLNPNADTFLIKNWTPSTIGNFYVALIISDTLDEYHNNDTLIDTVKVYMPPNIWIFVPYDTVGPTLDGFIRNSSLSDLGWAGAVEVEGSDYIGLGGGTQQVIGSCRILFKHDGNNLYIGILNANDNDITSLDRVVISIDDNDDKTWASDSSEGVNIIFPPPSGWISYYITPSDTQGLTSRPDMNSYFSFSVQSSYYYSFQFEVAIPFDTLKDPAKIKTSINDTVGLFVGVFSDNIGEYVCWWPQNSESISDIGRFGNVILTDVVGVGEGLGGGKTGDVKIYDVLGRRVIKMDKKGVYFVVYKGKVKKVIVR